MTSAEFLGPYRVGELIGRGGMGAVYEATHETSGERVAVKLISPHVADEMRFRRRFAAEVETLKRLRHPNIVRLLGYGEEKGQLFYSMELVEGESVRSVIRRQKRMPWVRVVDLAIQVCSALKHAHDMGVIHRDLKPANLLLNSAGEVKLVDFGIAKLFGFGEQTMAGSVLGTADYMAPEQADGVSITTRTDLYALGSSIYSMLVGRPPFSDKSVTNVMESLRNDRPISLQLIDPTLPDELSDLVAELLEKKPEDRPPTALVVGNRLKSMKMGLLRELTVSDEASKTKLGGDQFLAGGASQAGGGHMSSDPSLDSSEGDTAAGGAESRRGGTDRVSGEHAGRASENSGHPMTPLLHGAGGDAGVSSALTGRVKQLGPSEVTLDVGSGTSTQKRTESGTAHGKPVIPGPLGQPSDSEVGTHFQAVDVNSKATLESDALRGSDGYWWVQLLSVVGMIGILVAGGVLFWWSMMTPSADELYGRIVEAERSGRLGGVEPTMRLFVDAYPDDERAVTVQYLRDGLELERLLKRLKSKAKRAGGVERLSPHEQSFYRAMGIRREAPEEASAQLRDWLTLFQQAGEANELEVEAMAAMARSELVRLAGREPVVESDPRVEQLLHRIRSSREKLPADERLKSLRALRDLYAGEAWAQSVVARAEEEIAVIQETLAIDETPDGIGKN
ncbi:MAG: serine/threonine-protein kinase [Planctomycetota bacterium]